MKYQIVIPSWNQAALCCKCLETIREHSTGEDYEVIFVDNASEPRQLQQITQVLATLPHRLVRNTINTGFVKATNQGLYLTSAPYVVLMNNDTEAVAGWLGAMSRHLAGRVVAVGPRTTATGSWQGREKPFNGALTLKTNCMLAFFCTMFRREVFDTVGYLDEAYGVGFGDDDDYCYRLHKAGHRIALVGDLCIPHHHRTTFKALYAQDEIKQRHAAANRVFGTKHGVTMQGKPIVRPPAPRPRFAGVVRPWR